MYKNYIMDDKKNPNSLNWTEFFDESDNSSIINPMMNFIQNLRSPIEDIVKSPMKLDSQEELDSSMKSSFPDMSSIKSSSVSSVNKSIYESNNNFISKEMDKILNNDFDNQLESMLLQLPYDIIKIILSKLEPYDLIKFALTSKYAYSLIFTEEFGLKLISWIWENIHKLAVKVLFQIIEKNIKNIINFDDVELINETIEEVKNYANNIVLYRVNLDIQYYLVKQIIQIFLNICEYIQTVPDNYCSKLSQYDYHLRIILQEYDILSGIDVRKDLFNNPKKESICIWEKWYNDKLIVPLNDFLDHFQDWDDIQLSYLKYSIDFPVSGKVTKCRWMFLASQFNFKNLKQFKQYFTKFACSFRFAGPMNSHLAKNILENFKNHQKYKQIIILRQSRKYPGTLTLTFFKTIELNRYLDKTVVHYRLLNSKPIDKQICKKIKSDNYQLCPGINRTPPELVHKLSKD